MTVDPPQTLRHAQEQVRDLSVEYKNYDAPRLLTSLIYDVFQNRIGVSSSFGTGSAVVLHMVSKIDPYTPVVFLDTFKHFPETLAYRHRLIEELGLCNVQIVRPLRSDLDRDDSAGDLHVAEPDRCCEIRKVQPMARVFGRQKAWITGRRRTQTRSRNLLEPFEVQNQWIKVNPIYDWSASDLNSYFLRHKLPEHPLKEKGFLSIGCAPCTQKSLRKDHERSGRWSNSKKTECGLHQPLSR